MGCIRAERGWKIARGRGIRGIFAADDLWHGKYVSCSPPKPRSYSLNHRTSRTALHANSRSSLHKVRSRHVLVLVVVVLAEQILAECLQRVLGIAGDLFVAEEQGAVGATGRGRVLVILGGVAGFR